MKESALSLFISLPLSLELCDQLLRFMHFNLQPISGLNFNSLISLFSLQSHQVQLHHYHGLFKFINMPRSKIECKPMTSIKSFFLLSALFRFLLLFLLRLLCFISVLPPPPPRLGMNLKNAFHIYDPAIS